GGKGMEVAPGDGQDPTQAAVAIPAQEPAPGADVASARQALGASAAGDAGIDEHTRALGDRRARGGADNLSGHLVTHDAWIGHRDQAGEDLAIRTAEADRADLDEGLAGTRNRLRDIRLLDLVRLGQDGGLQR